jgi:hypothetical protein
MNTTNTQPKHKETAQQRTAEAAVFETVEQAEKVVQQLLDAGFTKEQITVVCSDEHKERNFGEFEHQEPAGTYTAEAVLTGGAIGALLGAIPVVGLAVATGSAIVWIAGSTLVGGLSVAGGLVGAMTTRGVEREVADYYQQAVVEGKILVSVEVEDAQQRPNLPAAADIFATHGARPIALRKG